MKKGLLSPLNPIHLERMDQILGEILKQAIAGAMPSQEGFDDIWRSIKDRLDDSEETPSGVTFRLREIV